MIEVIQSGKGHKQHIANPAPQQQQPQEGDGEESEESLEPPYRMPPINEEFEYLLKNSRQRLRNDELKRISKLMVFSEGKVYDMQTGAQKHYLAHILSVSEAKTQEKVLSLARQRQSQIEAAIFSSDLNIRKRPKVENIRKREEKLAMKLSLIGREMQNMSMMSGDGSNADLSHIVNSKYWDPSSEQTAKAKEFVQRLRSQKRKARNKLRELQSKSVQEMELKDKLEKEQQQKLLKERINDSVKKLMQYKRQREEQKTQREDRRREEAELLQKYQVKNPRFKQREKEFEKQFAKRQEEQRRRKLSEIKQKYRPLDNEEMQEHLKHYDEFKVKMQEEIAKRLLEQNLLNERGKELQDLYHGHYHGMIAEEEQKATEKKDRGKSVQDKILEYRESVLSQLKPRVDEKKKKELEILKLELEYKGKRVKKKIEENGDVVFEDLSPKLDHKKIGQQYLSELRKMHSQMTPRRRDSLPSGLAAGSNTSAAATASVVNSEPQKRNYLHEGTKGLKATLSNWKKDLNSQGLSRDQKYDLVLKKVEVIDQQARQKQMKLRLLKDQPQIMNVKESLDKYYLNSINAKLSVLNQVIYQK